MVIRIKDKIINYYENIFGLNEMMVIFHYRVGIIITMIQLFEPFVSFFK